MTKDLATVTPIYVKCSGCGYPIWPIETVFMWDDRPVCAECYWHAMDAVEGKQP